MFVKLLKLVPKKSRYFKALFIILIVGFGGLLFNCCEFFKFVDKDTASKLITKRTKVQIFAISSFSAFHGSSLRNKQPSKFNSLLINSDVSCNDVFLGNSTVLNRIKEYYAGIKNPTQTFEEEELKLASHLVSLALASCSNYLKERNYLLEDVHPEEWEFPIAYSIMAYKHVSQVERLLRAIYSPSNFYCIHIDKKAKSFIHDGIKSIARCLHNVYIIPDPIEVHWADISIVKADLKCMNYLVKNTTKWKYFINIAAQDFPAYGNRQLVRILKAYKNASDVDGSFDSHYDFRWKKSYTIKNGHVIYNSNTLKSPPPFNLTISKGYFFITANRNFAEKIIYDDKVVPAFLNWLKDTWVPDELFYTTLNHNPEIFPVYGSFNSSIKSICTYCKSFNTRYVVWQSVNASCRGSWQRDVCVFGESDLQFLDTVPHLFINKFDSTMYPITYQCMEEAVRNKTLEGRKTGEFFFNTSFLSDYNFITFRKIFTLM